MKTVCAITTRLGQRHPREWAERLAELAPEVQAHAASVVWWDFFGKRISRHRWVHLDRMLASYRPEQAAAPAALERALRHVGYSARRAGERSREPKGSTFQASYQRGPSRTR